MIVRIEPFGALLYLREHAATVRLDREETRRLLGYQGEFPSDLTAPEIVHIEISNRCNLNCNYCYVNKEGKELTSGQWKRIIKDLARNRVLQLTFELDQRGQVRLLAVANPSCVRTSMSSPHMWTSSD